MRRPVLGVGVLAALAALGYTRVRRPILTWGATEAEAHERLPGDELLEDVDGMSTRAVASPAIPHRRSATRRLRRNRMRLERSSPSAFA